VRLSKAKRTFKKGYLPNWTEELLTVVKCIETRPPVYLVKDDHGEILEGTFYAEEIQKVIKQDDVYKTQSVLKKRRKGRRVQYLVKWLGYPESFNSWIFKQDLPTAQQCRPQSTVLRFDRQVVNADYDNRVQDENLTQKYDLRSRYLFSKCDPRRCAVGVTRCHLQD
jgi:hypothetical protein